VSAHVRAIALALIRQDDRILVEEGQDKVKGETFFRLLGGTIEFGEKGADAVRRELREELGVDSEVGRLVGTLESIFTYEGKAGHEIALIYECTLLDDHLYELDRWAVNEETDGGSVTHTIAWKRLDSSCAGRETLYPDGLLELL
jgi:ADP-ribose pyrophosphatase YjhB (NUDIX family)